jgi:hypothetical protein
MRMRSLLPLGILLASCLAMPAPVAAAPPPDPAATIGVPQPLLLMHSGWPSPSTRPRSAATMIALERSRSVTAVAPRCGAALERQRDGVSRGRRPVDMAPAARDRPPNRRSRRSARGDSIRHPLIL